jgi:hypothetical protein
VFVFVFVIVVSVVALLVVVVALVVAVSKTNEKICHQFHETLKVTESELRT